MHQSYDIRFYKYIRLKLNNDGQFIDMLLLQLTVTLHLNDCITPLDLQLDNIGQYVDMLKGQLLGAL